jgi:hypothetical protein
MRYVFFFLVAVSVVSCHKINPGISINAGINSLTDTAATITAYLQTFEEDQLNEIQTSLSGENLTYNPSNHQRITN